MNDSEFLRQIRTPTAREAFEQIVALRGYTGADQGRVAAYAICAEVAERGLRALLTSEARKPESQIVPDDPEQGANKSGIPEMSFQKEESLFRQNENITNAVIIDALTSASHALRSYEFGNGSPVLASRVADLCNGVLAKLKASDAVEKPK